MFMIYCTYMEDSAAYHIRCVCMAAQYQLQCKTMLYHEPNNDSWCMTKSSSNLGLTRIGVQDCWKFLHFSRWSPPVWECMEQHWLSYVGSDDEAVSDIWDVLRWRLWLTGSCVSEGIKLLYSLFMFETYIGLIHGRRSSTRLPLPLLRFQGRHPLQNCGSQNNDGWQWDNITPLESCTKKTVRKALWLHATGTLIVNLTVTFWPGLSVCLSAHFRPWRNHCVSV